MTKQAFFIPIRPVSWNRIATAHWRVYKEYKDALAQATWVALKQAKLKPYAGQIRIEATAHWKDKRSRDVDNLFIKSVLDQMVKEEIIKDDSLNYVLSVAYFGKTGSDKEGFEIILVPMSVL